MKKFVGFILAVALAGGAYFWWHHSSTSAAEPDEEVKGVAEVAVAPLKTAEVAKTVDTVGVVQGSAAGAVAMTLGYDCVVTSVAAPVGTRVAQGDDILSVDPTPDAKLAIESAKASASLAKEALEAAKQKYQLKLITNDDLRTAQQAASDATLKAESLSRRAMAEGGKITAPSGGVVTKLDPTVGTVVPAGTALFTLAADEHLEARLAVEASDLGAIKNGQIVSVAAVGRDDVDSVAGTVSNVGNAIDPATGSADVHVGLPAGSGLYPGEHVRGAIVVESETGLAVPRAAVLPDDERQILFSVKDHKAVKHEVEVKIEGKDIDEIACKDLKEGDSIVVQGNYELEDGMSVRLAGEAPKDDEPAAKADQKDAGNAKDTAVKKDAPKAEDKP